MSGLVVCFPGQRDASPEERIIEPPRLIPRRLGSIATFSGVFGNLELATSLTRREISARYRGSLLGFCWPILQPILLLGVYTFIFSTVFGARWPGVYEDDLVGYAVVVFSGLVTFNIFGESVRTSPKLLLSNRNFVKRVVFPLELLPVVQVAAAVVHAGAGFLVLLVFLVLSGAPLHWTACWVPVVWLVFAIFSLGVCYFLSTLSVFLRDLEPVIGILITGLFFGSAIFYPIERLPEVAQTLVRTLPTGAAVDLTRSLLLLGELPGPEAFLGALAVSFAFLFVGYALFMKAKGSFADAL